MPDRLSIIESSGYDDGPASSGLSFPSLKSTREINSLTLENIP
ncbi:MAG: hypothetical protein WCH43_08825 [Verrucomicrobiota bacterium]